MRDVLTYVLRCTVDNNRQFHKIRYVCMYKANNKELYNFISTDS